MHNQDNLNIKDIFIKIHIPLAILEAEYWCWLYYITTPYRAEIKDSKDKGKKTGEHAITINYLFIW